MRVVAVAVTTAAVKKFLTSGEGMDGSCDAQTCVVVLVVVPQRQCMASSPCQLRLATRDCLCIVIFETRDA